MHQTKWVWLLSVVMAESGVMTQLTAVSPASQSIDKTAVSARIGSKSLIEDPQRERAALRILLDSVRREVTSAAEAMPADKYGFAPTTGGEFQGVRTFGAEVKHLAATNQILAAAALGDVPPPEAGDETGPETVRTKAEILGYLSDSFDRLGKAIDAIGNDSLPVKSSPISPLRADQATRTALVSEALIHTFNHYGQMVVYLRMNGVVPPASRP